MDRLALVSEATRIYPSLSASPPSAPAVFGPGRGDGAGLGDAGVLRPEGIGGRMGLALDPGRLSEEGDAAADSSSASGCGASGVSPDAVRK